MPKSASRPSLATSSSAFALPLSSASSCSNPDGDLLPSHRLRRSSLMAPKALHATNSPLASSFSPSAPYPYRRKSVHRSSISSETGSESDRMLQDSSPSCSSENTTPPLPADSPNEDTPQRPTRSVHPPSTPPRRYSMDDDIFSPSPTSNKRPSLPVKPPRVLRLLSESRPEETEVKSEAAFQRLVSSQILPLHPRTPRGSIDRGRYPEEANTDEYQREDTPSDDEDFHGHPFLFHPVPTECVDASSLQSLAADDAPCIQSLDSISNGRHTPMEIEMAASPSVSSSSMTQWRYTPPPICSAVRSNKRKLEDRFDPYPSTNKRRAVSPSIAHLREAHSISGTPGHGRPSRISIPVSSSALSSATSSPTISSSYPTISRQLPVLSSPIVRPIPRPRKEGEEREVDGTDEAVNSLSLA